MLTLDAKSFTGLSSGILSMRKNVQSIRKTLLNQRNMRKALDTKVKLQDKRLQENKAKKAKEQDVERKKTLKGGKKLGLRSNVFKKPELAFGIPGIGVLGSVLTFFSFVFIDFPTALGNSSFWILLFIWFYLFCRYSWYF